MNALSGHTKQLSFSDLSETWMRSALPIPASQKLIVQQDWLVSGDAGPRKNSKNFSANEGRSPPLSLCTVLNLPAAVGRSGSRSFGARRRCLHR
jgi:hypothetical protein